MADLIGKSAFDNLLLVEIGGITVTEVDRQPITNIQPLKGQAKKVSSALQTAVGVALPGPGEAFQSKTSRILWSGPGQAILIGAHVDIRGAALIDQSDSWAMVAIQGPGARDVLARLTPLDIRPSVFGPGQTARTLIGHMTGQITPLEGETFELMVFRSMAGTLLHDVTRAATHVVGRRTLA